MTIATHLTTAKLGFGKAVSHETANQVKEHAHEHPHTLPLGNPKHSFLVLSKFYDKMIIVYKLLFFNIVEIVFVQQRKRH